MTSIEKFNAFLQERMRLASSIQTMSAYTIVQSTFNDLFHPVATYELHFCEGSYMMAKVKGSEQGIIDNTLTEFLGEITCSQRQCEIVLILMQKAYELNKKFPIDDVTNSDKAILSDLCWEALGHTKLCTNERLDKLREKLNKSLKEK